ncbi:MAG: TonB-dependent receptor [Gammaproteobacteria bacterium HGW-Gammaproteobacteria-15]|nr:MAG: TonB-dependent receptor [Gammaproteobacteria bacterium HGW-Gammaproteobacteria-15]
MRTKLFRNTLTATAVAASLSNLAVAQEVTENVEEAKAERIVVLGSRIRTDGLDNAAPVEVINASVAVSQGITNLAELLRNSTIAGGSNQVTSASSTAFVSNGGVGGENISLRGLGANRTLVLLNGRRAGPAGTRGAVSSFDPNVLPLSAIERVEILKDGASSLYGSDAVAGVINIITKTNDDTSVNINTSQPFEAGGETLDFDFTIGRSFDRGSLRFVADYKMQKQLAQGQRDYFACGERYVFDPNTGERADLVDPRTGKYHCADLPWGHVWIYDYAEDSNIGAGTKAQYDYDGNLGQFIPGFGANPANPEHMSTPPGWFPVAYDSASDAVFNSDHPFQDQQSLIPKKELLTAYLQGDYSLSDDVTLYGEALMNRRTTTTNSYRQFWTYIYNGNWDFANGIGGGNDLYQGWNGAQWYSPTPITDHSGSKIVVDYKRFVVGLNGELDNWFWDIAYQQSYNDGTYRNKVIFEDAVTSSEFAAGSCVGEQTAVRGVPCIDVPWLDPQFLAGDMSNEVKAFLFGEEEGRTVYKQSSVEANISGDLFELSSGIVAVAFGASFQQDSIVDTPGAVTLADNAWGSSGAGITAGKSNTRAIFGEVHVPIVRDVMLMESLDLTMSARYTDVSTYGSDTTYKIGINWMIGGGLRLRASRGTSFRSPALYELYLNNQTTFASQRSIDPCIRWGQGLENGTTNALVAANCEADGLPADFAGGASSATVTTAGGLGELKAETSVAKTIGLVWTPATTTFSASVDYFNIAISDEVTLLTAAEVIRGCYDSEIFGSEPLCDRFSRSSVDNRIEAIDRKYLNIADQKNRGVDIMLNYSIDSPVGEFQIRYEHTVQLEAESQLFPTSKPEDDVGLLGSPKHVANLKLGLNYDDWSFNWLVRYVGSGDNYTDYGNGTYRDTAVIRGETVKVVAHADAYTYHTFSTTKIFGDTGLTGTLGVSNIFDKAPPQVTTLGAVDLDVIGNSAFYSQYDWIGRRVFLNLSYAF